MRVFILQIAKIDIGYAKAAKKMDVKKLKSSMWSLLTIPDDQPPNETVSLLSRISTVLGSTRYIMYSYSHYYIPI